MYVLFGSSDEVVPDSFVLEGAIELLNLADPTKRWTIGMRLSEGAAVAVAFDADVAFDAGTAFDVDTAFDTDTASESDSASFQYDAVSASHLGSSSGTPFLSNSAYNAFTVSESSSPFASDTGPWKCFQCDNLGASHLGSERGTPCASNSAYNAFAAFASLSGHDSSESAS